MKPNWFDPEHFHTLKGEHGSADSEFIPQMERGCGEDNAEFCLLRRSLKKRSGETDHTSEPMGVEKCPFVDVL
jgi:hypothetical protein